MGYVRKKVGSKQLVALEDCFSGSIVEPMPWYENCTSMWSGLGKIRCQIRLNVSYIFDAKFETQKNQTIILMFKQHDIFRDV